MKGNVTCEGQAAATDKVEGGMSLCLVGAGRSGRRATLGDQGHRIKRQAVPI